MTQPATLFHFSAEAASSIVHENCVKMSAWSLSQPFERKLLVGLKKFPYYESFLSRVHLDLPTQVLLNYSKIAAKLRSLEHSSFLNAVELTTHASLISNLSALIPIPFAGICVMLPYGHTKLICCNDKGVKTHYILL